MSNEISRRPKACQEKKQTRPTETKEKTEHERFVFRSAKTKRWSWWRTLILTKRRSSWCPLGYERPVLVSCTGCSPNSADRFFPLILMHGHQPCQTPGNPSLPCARSVTAMLPDRHHADWLFAHWTTPVCLIVLHYLSNVSLEMGDVLLGKDGP